MVINTQIWRLAVMKLINLSLMFKFVSGVEIIFLRNFPCNIRRLLHYESYELQYSCDKSLNGCSLCKQLPRGSDLLRRALIAFSAEKLIISESIAIILLFQFKLQTRLKENREKRAKHL